MSIVEVSNMGRHWQRLQRFIRTLLRRFLVDRGTESAAALTYTTLFAVVPMMTVMFVMLSAIPAFRELGGPLQELIVKNFVPSASEQLVSYLGNFSQQARKLTWVGVGVLLFTALFTLHSIEQAFNRIWRVRRARRGTSGFLLYWALLSLGPMLLGAGFAITTYLKSLVWLNKVGNLLPGSALLLQQLPMLLEVTAFTLLYSVVPNAPVRLRHAVLGGLFTAVLFDLAKWVFAQYISLFPGYQLVYGAFAVVPLFLFWLYLSWLIVLLGAELVCLLGLPWDEETRRPQLLNLFGVLALLLQSQTRGMPLQRVDVVRAGWGMCESDWEELIGFLESDNLICRVRGGGWVLCRDLHQIPLAGLLRRCPWPLPPIETFPLAREEHWYMDLRQALLALDLQRERLLERSVADWLGRSSGQP